MLAVFTASNLGLETQPPELPGLNARMVRDLLARTHVRFVGEPYAAIVARSAEEAADAVEFVEVTYEPLPVVVDIDDALSDQVLLHPAAGTNTALEMGTGDAFDHDEIRVEATIRHSIVAPTPLEGRSALARPSDGKLTMWVSGQGPHPYRDLISRALGMAREDLRVVCPDVGGGFGGKAIPHPEEMIVAQVARRLGVPILWVDTRTESMLSLGPSRGQQQHIVLSGRRDGTITGVEMDITQDSGAYPRLGAFMTNMARLMLPGPYQIPRVHLRARSVVTNTNPHLAFRGAGQPEYASAVEHVVDKFARRLGLDPLEVRRRNLLRADCFPYTSPTGVIYDSGDYERALDLLSADVDYRGLREQQATRRQDGLARAWASVSPPSSSRARRRTKPSGAAVVVNHDATVDAWTGTSPHGQGHETTWATLIERELGVSTADIRVHFGDTDHFESGTVTGGSRSVQTGGVASHSRRDRGPRAGAARRRRSARSEDRRRGVRPRTTPDSTCRAHRHVSSSSPSPHSKERTGASKPRCATNPPATPSPSVRIWRWSKSIPRQARSTCNDSSPSMTAAPSSITRSSKVRYTAVLHRASGRPCSKRSSTTATAIC